jgi:hypothetical protein
MMRTHIRSGQQPPHSMASFGNQNKRPNLLAQMIPRLPPNSAQAMAALGDYMFPTARAPPPSSSRPCSILCLVLVSRQHASERHPWLAPPPRRLVSTCAVVQSSPRVKGAR